MKFVEESKKLEIKNLLKYSGIIYSHEMDDIIGDMVTYAESKDKVKVLKVLTITKGISFETGMQKMIMEFYIELNQPSKGNNKYAYIPKYELNNCVYSKYKGHSQNASMATREVQEYIKNNELNPIGPVHQLMYIDKKRKRKHKKNEVLLEVYIQVN